MDLLVPRARVFKIVGMRFDMLATTSPIIPVIVGVLARIRSCSDLVILTLLRERLMDGYEMLLTLNKRGMGEFRFGQGTLYPGHSPWLLPESSTQSCNEPATARSRMP